LPPAAPHLPFILYQDEVIPLLKSGKNTGYAATFLSTMPKQEYPNRNEGSGIPHSGNYKRDGEVNLDRYLPL